MKRYERKHILSRGLRLLLCLVIGIMPTLLPGCGLIPKEEELPAAPMLEEADTEEYVLTPVIRGDLIVTQTIRSSYIPSASEKLAFPIGGEYIGHVYVSLGDEVKAGDVLMELDLTNVENQIEAQEIELDSLYLQLSQLYEQEALALEEARILDRQAADNEVQGWTSRESGVYATYGQQIQAINNTITISEARLAELQADKAKRQLIATIDGVVTDLYNFDEGERSTKDRTVIQISNMDEALFEVYSTNTNLLEMGQTYTLICNQTEYEVIARTGEELGIETLRPDGVYFQMVTPDPSIAQNSTGTVTVVEAQSLNTLYVQADVVQTVQGQPVVYILNEDGYRTMQPVKTGLKNNKVIEILEGLSEGDYVIVP